MDEIRRLKFFLTDVPHVRLPFIGGQKSGAVMANNPESGEQAHGGSFSGAGVSVANGVIFVNSGYGNYNHMAGNILLAIGPKEKKRFLAANYANYANFFRWSCADFRSFGSALQGGVLL